SVWRLRQWSSSRYRSIYFQCRIKMATDEWARDAVASWLRGSGSGTLQLPSRKIFTTIGGIQYDCCQSDYTCYFLPFAKKQSYLACQKTLCCFLTEVAAETSRCRVPVKRIYVRLLCRGT